MVLAAGSNGKARENTKVHQDKGYIKLCQILIVRLIATVAIKNLV